MIIIGFIISIGVIFSAILFAGGKISLFIDPISVILTIIPPILLVFLSGQKKAFIHGLKIAVSDKKLKDSKQENCSRTFDYLFKATIITGIILTMTGAVLLIVSKGLKADHFRVGVSTAMLSTYYSLIIGFFLYLPIKLKADNM